MKGETNFISTFCRARAGLNPESLIVALMPLNSHASSETVLGKSGSCGAAITQFIEFWCQVSVPPPAKRTAVLIEKETDEL